MSPIFKYDCASKVDEHYKNLNYNSLLLEIENVKTRFQEIKNTDHCESKDKNINKLRYLLVELDYISLALAKYQDSATVTRFLYHEISEKLHSLHSPLHPHSHQPLLESQSIYESKT